MMDTDRPEDSGVPVLSLQSDSKSGPGYSYGTAQSCFECQQKQTGVHSQWQTSHCWSLQMCMISLSTVYCYLYWWRRWDFILVDRGIYDRLITQGTRHRTGHTVQTAVQTMQVTTISCDVTNNSNVCFIHRISKTNTRDGTKAL